MPHPTTLPATPDFRPKELSARPTTFQAIRRWRDMYRLEMGCQIIHDSIHERPGWSQEYALLVDGTPVGYGSVAIGGPWRDEHAAYEFYVVPNQRGQVLELFRAFLSHSGAVSIEVQSNDVLATNMLHAFVPNAVSEAILFEDGFTTFLRPEGATFREPTRLEEPDTPADCLPWSGVVEVAGEIAGKGGILFHYNRPFGDIYMEVAEPFRGRGIGAFIVQELKRVCYEGGHVPAARCNPHNLASRRTLQKAGFIPCGHILKGMVADRAAPPASV